MRMNCRSRPTCSSIFLRRLLRVPALDGVGDDRGDLVGVVGRRRSACRVEHPPVDLGPQLVVVAQPLTESHDVLRDLRAQRAVRVVDGFHDHPLGDRPRSRRETGHLLAPHDLGLDLLGLLHGRGVVLQVVGEVDEEPVGRLPHLVLRVGSHLPGEFDEFPVDLLAEHGVDELGRPGGRIPADDPVDGLLTPERPLVRPLGEQIQDRQLPVLVEEFAEYAPDRRPPLGLGQPAHEGAVDDLLHVLVAQDLDEAAQDRGRLGSDTRGVLGLAIHVPDAAAGSPRPPPSPTPPRGPGSSGRRSCSRLAPSWSFFCLMIAVCGIGNPSGCRNSAVTANQSASAPTMPASDAART